MATALRAIESSHGPYPTTDYTLADGNTSDEETAGVHPNAALAPVSSAMSVESLAHIVKATLACSNPLELVVDSVGIVRARNYVHYLTPRRHGDRTGKEGRNDN